MSDPAAPTADAAAARTEWFETLKAYDRDRYISALLAPAAARDDLLVLYAFDAELARIPWLVSEPLLTEIRLQWWRDALAPLLTQTTSTSTQARTGHPLADAMLELARRRGLPGGLLHGLIDARSAEVAEVPLRDEAVLLGYLEKTDVGLLRLASTILDQTAAAQSPFWPESVGRALGYTRLARRLAVGDPRAEMLVPLDLWRLDDRHTHAGDGAATVRYASARRAALRTLCDRARNEAGNAAAACVGLPRVLRPALLPLALVPRYLSGLEPVLDARTDPAAAVLRTDINPLLRVWTLWRARHKPAVL